MNGSIIAPPATTFLMEQERDGGSGLGYAVQRGVLQLNAEITSPDDLQNEAYSSVKRKFTELFFLPRSFVISILSETSFRQSN